MELVDRSEEEGNDPIHININSHQPAKEREEESKIFSEGWWISISSGTKHESPGPRDLVKSESLDTLVTHRWITNLGGA